MSRFVNFSMIFVMSFGTVSLPFESALACGHGGGGGRSYGRTTSYYSAPRVVQPQIVYVPVQSAAPQQTVISQPVSGQYQSEPWQTNMVGNPNGSVAQPNVGQPNISGGI